MTDHVPLDFIGIRVELPTNTPILLLKERDGDRYLPIWINTPEATSIALAHDGYAPQRPMTHDLLTAVIEELGATVEEIVITELRGGTFFADLVLRVDDDIHTISSRPSDAVSVAVRVDAPLFAVTDVLNEAGVLISDETEEDEVAKFREFLDEIDPEDFEAGHSQ
jgi:bifunctional DNase/RNase